MLTAQGFQTQQDHASVDQLVPHSASAEQAVIGALAIDPGRMIDVGYLESLDFYITSHQLIYAAMKVLFDKNNTYDLITLTNRLEADGHLESVGGPGAIADFINYTPTSFNAAHYAEIVRNSSVLRAIINEALHTTQAAYAGNAIAGEVVGDAITRFSGINVTNSAGGGPQNIENAADELLDRREVIQANGGTLPGVMTSIKTVDAILDGLETNRLYILAGRPGMGKSALFLQIAYNAALAGNGILVFSLEMNEVEIIARLASIHCRVPYKDILAGRGDDTAICQAIQFVSMLPIIIDSTPGLTVAEIRSRSQRAMIDDEISLIGIDHGGLVKPAKIRGDSYNDTNLVASELQRLPKQLGLPVVSLLQINRAATTRNDKIPHLSDLRDTGKWEENADGVLFIHRDEYYNPNTLDPNLCEIIVAKNRAGASGGKATVYADVSTNRFIDLETESVKL